MYKFRRLHSLNIFQCNSALKDPHLDLAVGENIASTTTRREILVKTSTGEVVEEMGTILEASRSANGYVGITQQKR